jgi:hypothetical protein
LIEAELTAVIGAAPHERTPDRTGLRNGSRPRTLTTPAGGCSINLRERRQASQRSPRPDRLGDESTTDRRSGRGRDGQQRGGLVIGSPIERATMSATSMPADFARLAAASTKAAGRSKLSSIRRANSRTLPALPAFAYRVRRRPTPRPPSRRRSGTSPG